MAVKYSFSSLFQSAGTIEKEGGRRAESGREKEDFFLPDLARRAPSFSIVSTDRERETGYLSQTGKLSEPNLSIPLDQSRFLFLIGTLPSFSRKC